MPVLSTALFPPHGHACCFCIMVVAERLVQEHQVNVVRLQLTPEQQAVCRRDFELLELRLADSGHRFLNMLEAGTYREHREVTYYADCLCVTSKYLSEVSKKVSGYAANYWINRYTILDITRLLRDKSLIFVQISDMFGFSSPAYFSRYVQQNLGIRPSDYRD